MREIHQLVASLTRPNRGQGSNLQPSYVPLSRIFSPEASAVTTELNQLGLETSNVDRPRTLLNMLECTGQPPPQQRIIQPTMSIVPIIPVRAIEKPQASRNSRGNSRAQEHVRDVGSQRKLWSLDLAAAEFSNGLGQRDHGDTTPLQSLQTNYLALSQILGYLISFNNLN